MCFQVFEDGINCLGELEESSSSSLVPLKPKAYANTNKLKRAYIESF